MELVTKLGRSQYGVPSANTVFRSFRSGSLVLVSHFWRGVTEQKNRSASSRFLGNLSWSQDTNTRKPTHGNYRFLPHPATELRSSFHGPDLPDIRGDRHGLDHLSGAIPKNRCLGAGFLFSHTLADNRRFPTHPSQGERLCPSANPANGDSQRRPHSNRGIASRRSGPRSRTSSRRSKPNAAMGA